MIAAPDTTPAIVPSVAMATMKYKGNAVPSKTVCRFAPATVKYSTSGNARARKKNLQLRKLRRSS